MKSMLIIDGSTILAGLFAGIFQKSGWEVVVCGDRASAIERLVANERYDVILLGCRVMGATSVELVNAIRSLEHRRATAVIMITGSDEITDEALAAGADEVLLRPINPNCLRWVIDKLVP